MLYCLHIRVITVIGQLGHNVIGNCSNQMLNMGKYMHAFKCQQLSLEFRVCWWSSDVCYVFVFQ